MEIKVNMEKRHFLKRWMQGMGFAFLLMGMAACTSEEEEISDRNRDAILGTWRCTGYEYNSDAYEMDLEVEITENMIYWTFGQAVPLVDYTQGSIDISTAAEYQTPYVVTPSGDQGDEVSDWTISLENVSGFRYEDLEEACGFGFYISNYTDPDTGESYMTSWMSAKVRKSSLDLNIRAFLLFRGTLRPESAMRAGLRFRRRLYDIHHIYTYLALLILQSAVPFNCYFTILA